MRIEMTRGVTCRRKAASLAANNMRPTPRNLLIQEIDAKTVAKENILSSTLRVRDHLCLYVQDLTSLNSAAPDFLPSAKTENNLKKAFGTLKRVLSKAIEIQEKKEAYRRELTLERAYAAVLAIESRKVCDYDGFAVKKTLERSATRIKNAFNEMPSRFSMMPDEIKMIRDTWFMVGITVYRAGIQPASRERAKEIFDSLLANEMQPVSAVIEASALIHEIEKYSKEIPLCDLLDISARAMRLEKNINVVFEKLKEVEPLNVSQNRKKQIGIVTDMARHIYNASFDFEHATRQHIAASGCLSVAPPRVVK